MGFVVRYGHLNKVQLIKERMVDLTGLYEMISKCTKE